MAHRPKKGIARKFSKLITLRAEKTTESRKELRRMQDCIVRPDRTSVKLVKQQLADIPLFASHL